MLGRPGARPWWLAMGHVGWQTRKNVVLIFPILPLMPRIDQSTMLDHTASGFVWGMLKRSRMTYRREETIVFNTRLARSGR